MTVATGTRIGRYDVRAPLGAGGMGEVYVAHDPELDRDVAIKVIRDRDAHSPERVHRFIQEAKAASALNHPNVAHVYEIGSQDGLRFIAMEMVPGETLRDRIARGPMPVVEAIAIALQVSAALAAAHKAGIIHRDIKPENIIVRPDGYAKVLDFGLAKLREPDGDDDAATLVKTATGIAMGTFGYMAPEQLAGEHATSAADVYALGIVLYEMIAGNRPGPGGPRASALPASVQPIVAKATAKNPRDRYPSAVEMHDALRAVPTEPRPRSMRGALIAAVVLAVLAAAGFAIWSSIRSRQVADARKLVASAERFYAQHDVVAAYDAAMRAARVIPDDDRLIDVITAVTQKVKIDSDPPGATIYVQRFKGPAQRERIGTTPLELPRFMRADYLATMEKNGYAPVTRPLSIAPIWARDYESARMPGTLQVKLLPQSMVPSDMVYVAGAPYRLQAWDRASDKQVDLKDFFIDKFEVSNAQFANFIRSGGYRHPQLFGPLPIYPESAMLRFRDTTNVIGPRSWSSGSFPAGRDNYPVTDVTWYEANAYCQSSGKKLPTIYQWERAGRYPGTRGSVTTFPWGFVAEGVDVTERANFLGRGTVPVDSMPFGMSTWGAQHMAGNVSEWVRNEKAPGHAARGGSWNDATYAFGQTAAFPPFYSSATLGFRCVKEIVPGDSGEFPLPAQQTVPVYKPVGDATYNEIRKRYDYPNTPLSARVTQRAITSDWTKETITFDVAGKQVLAYLYLPHGYQPPYQVIYFSPAGDVTKGQRTLAASIESRLVAHVRSGRAVFAVAMEGFIDRPRSGPFERPDSSTEEYVDFVAEAVRELRRGIDYLETRPDIDAKRIAFEADSAGVWAGVILCAVETRFKSVLFVGSGLEPEEPRDALAANRINFAPHMREPKLMLQGRYDEDSPYYAHFLPLWNLMKEPKRAVVFEGPHVPPREVYLRESQKWFDETLGKVQ